jgi:cell division transport system permease protein
MTNDKRTERKAKRARLKALKHTRRAKLRNGRRIIKYGFLGLARNTWLTLAAILVMTISLIIVSVTAVSRLILTDTVDSIKNTIEISVYLKTETTNDTANQIATDIANMSTVESVSTTSPQQALDEQIHSLREKGLDEDTVSTILEAPNTFPWIINVSMIDLEDLEELDWYLATNPLVTDNLSDRQNSDSRTDRLESIDKITGTTQFIEKIGIAIGIIFAAVGAIIIVNTIRMAIFNRKEEIQMMKLVGAGKGFIRGPFIIEAMMYGIISAVIAVALVVSGLYLLEEPLSRYGVVIAPTIQLIRSNILLVTVGVMAIGALVGIGSAMFAARKYLNIK